MALRYEVGEEIGSGAVGTVHRGRQIRPSRSVAIKILRSEYAHDEIARHRFVQEADICARFNHPNIVRIYDVIDDDEGPTERPAIVMELLEGDTLKDRLDRGPLSVEEAIRIARDALAALEHAHNSKATEEGEAAPGVIHRDIKPANLFLHKNLEGGQDRVVVTDFGIAKVAGAADVTRTGDWVLTVGYMSPEQADGTPVDLRTDLYSLGIVLYEMLTGKPPFVAEMPLAVVYAHLHKEPAALPEELPLYLRQAVSKALEKDPAKRFQNAAEFRAALNSSAKPVSTAPRGKWIKLLAVAAMILGLTAFFLQGLATHKELVTRHEPINFRTTYLDDKSLPEGKFAPVTNGVPGSLTIIQEVTYHWGREASRRLVERRVEKEPVAEVIKMGVKKAVTVKWRPAPAPIPVKADPETSTKPRKKKVKAHKVKGPKKKNRRKGRRSTHVGEAPPMRRSSPVEAPAMR